MWPVIREGSLEEEVCEPQLEGERDWPERRGVGAALQVGEQPPGRGQGLQARFPLPPSGLASCDVACGPACPAQRASACSLPLS